MHDVIARKIGADIAVIARTHEELRKIVERNFTTMTRVLELAGGGRLP